MTTANPTKCDRRGKELSLYFNTGDDETQIWVFHQGIIGDLNLGEVEDDEELATRSPTRLVKEYIEGDIEVSITGQQLVDEDYEGYLFLYAMRAGGASRDVMCLTGPIDTDGVVGWRGKMRNKDRSISGAAQGGMTASISLKPAACTDVAVRAVKIDGGVEETLGDSVVEDWDPTTYTAPA